MKHAIRNIIMAAFATLLASHSLAAGRKGPVRVTIWDERQPAQLTVYKNHLGNEIAEYLRAHARIVGGKPEWTVASVGLDDPDQGLPMSLLDSTDVLIWWGHVRHADVKDDLANDIVKRIQAGHLRLIALHSAHWSKPFRFAMNARSVEDALHSLPESERASATVVQIPPDLRLMDRKERLTPYWEHDSSADGKITLRVKLPSCVFPFVAAEGKPSHLRTLLTNHPIAKGVPPTWDITQTECYGGPFHVPHPDAQIFEEKWDNGESFPSGCYWRVGKGEVFYFRPGHETYPVFKEPIPLTVVENAVRWLGSHAK